MPLPPSKNLTQADIIAIINRQLQSYRGLLRLGTANNTIRLLAGEGVSIGGTKFSNSPFRVDMDGNVTMSSATITGGAITGTIVNTDTIGATSLKLQGRDYNHDLVFSITDADTIAWAAGTLRFADGTSYSIGAGNTGNMAARTWIYFDKGVSTTALQTTTTLTTAVGNDKKLLATAINGATEPTFTIFSGLGGINIDGSQIVPASVTSAELGSNSVTTAKITDLNVTTGKIDDLAVTTAKIAANNVTAAKVTATMRTGFIPLDLFSTREIVTNNIPITSGTDAGILSSDSGPRLERINGATDKGIRVVWAAANVDEVQLPTFAYPPDLDDTAAVTVNILAKMSGATDTPTLTVSYFEGVGDTNAGAATSALSSTLTQKTVTIAAGDVGAYPTFASVGITPGAHGTDAVEIYAVWIEYTRK